jgi:hypothetical protein
MKNYFRVILSMSLMLFAAALITSCTHGGLGTTGNITSLNTAIFGEYYGWQSRASLWVNDPGFTYNDVNYPITGTPFDGAKVVFCDSTARKEVVATSNGPGSYTWDPLVTNAGDIVYFKVGIYKDHPNYYFTSENRPMSDSFCTITSPSSSEIPVTLSPPFDVTWTLTMGNFPASALMFEIYLGSSGILAYRKSLPLTQNTFTVNNIMVSSYGIYMFKITPYFELNFNSDYVYMYSRALVYSVRPPIPVNVNVPAITG